MFGARSAMPMHQARRLVGATAVVLPPRGVVYGVASRRVFDTVRSVVPVLEQLSFDEAFGEPPELAGASADGRRGVLRGLAAPGCATRPAWSPRSARIGQADRQDRLRPGQTRRHPGGPPRRGTACCWTGCRCAGCGASARSPRRSCTASASRPSAACRADRRRSRQHPRARPSGPRCTGSPAASTTGPSPRTRPGQADQRRIHLRRRPDHPRPAARGGRARSASTRTSACCEGRPRRAHRHGEAEEVRHEHADPLGDAALRHHRRRDADRDGPPAAARPGRDRPHSPCRRWLFGPIATSARSRCSRTWSWWPRTVSDTGTAADAAPRPPRRRRPGASATTSCTPNYGHGWIQGAGPRRDDGAVRDPRHRPRAGAHASRRRPRTSTAPTRSTAWTGPTTSTRCGRATSAPAGDDVVDG